MMKLVQIPPEAARQTWPLIDAWIEDATGRSNGRFTPDAILAEIESGDQQLWIVWNTEKAEARAVGVSQLLVYPTGMKVADVIILTGEGRKDWKHVLTSFEEWAKEQGCGIAQVLARRGWARELPDYKMSHVLLEKRL